jgi:hypothetical protein
VFVHDISHGYDFQRTRLNLAPARATVRSGTSVKLIVAADHGWQNTGLLLEAGQRYTLKATGQYTLASEPKPWVSEPNGVTIRYCRGLPLGILLAAVQGDEGQEGQSPFLRPQVIGAGASVEPKQSGTLYLRVNDFAGELADNTGSADVEVASE